MVGKDTPFTETTLGRSGISMTVFTPNVLYFERKEIDGINYMLATTHRA
jgi:hypothetical protein